MKVNEDRLYSVVGEVLAVNPEALSEESSSTTIATWDSLNHLNLILALDSEFGISLSVDDAIELRSVGVIRAKLRQRGVEI
jgi:acyl carrier protein